MNSNKLKTKDYTTIVLMSLLNILVFGIGTVLYLTPITILATPVVYALLQGIVFFMLGVKVPKKGAILIYCIIQGVVAFNIPYILCYVLAGFAAEAILKKTGYGSMKGLTISHIVIQLISAVGSTIYPYAIILNSTLNGIQDGGDLAVNIAAAGHMIQSWGLLVLIAAIIIAGYVGAAFGKLAVKKHLNAKEVKQ